jgi:mono/diheme cytochrome c family protein
MLLNLLLVFVLIALIVIFVCLAWRASRTRFAFLKWMGRVFFGLLALMAAGLAIIVVIGTVRLNLAAYSYPTSDVKVAMTSFQVQRGEQLAHACIDCHSSSGQLPLDGSKNDFLSESGLPFGTMYSPNLTPAGLLKTWSDTEILRAQRERVDQNGLTLMIMPSKFFRSFSDGDAAALVAYLRSQPPVERALPKRSLSPLAVALTGAGMFPTAAQPPISGPVDSPQPGTPDYGKYLAASLGCADCHGTDFKGLTDDQGPNGPNL